MTDRQKREPTPEEKAEADRRFFRRLTDWSDPGALTIIRDGVPLDTSAPIVPPAIPTTVIGTDDDGNLLMSEGTIRVRIAAGRGIA